MHRHWWPILMNIDFRWLYWRRRWLLDRVLRRVAGRLSKRQRFALLHSFTALFDLKPRIRWSQSEILKDIFRTSSRDGHGWNSGWIPEASNLGTLSFFALSVLSGSSREFEGRLPFTELALSMSCLNRFLHYDSLFAKWSINFLEF